MSNIRLFFSTTLSADMIDKLDKSQSHYLIKVMRVKENEVFSLFNKKGEWEAKILKISKNIVEFIITKQLRQKENTKELWLDKKNIKNEKFLDWAKSTDKKDLKKLQKDNIKPALHVLDNEISSDFKHALNQEKIEYQLAPIPATSPTLSPTLSAITPGFLGSSSGIPASTLPTKSAPTSAPFVKIPPPSLAKHPNRTPKQ